MNHHPNEQDLEFLAGLTPEEQAAALTHLAREPYSFPSYCRGVAEAHRSKHFQKVRSVAAAFTDQPLIAALRLVGVSERDRVALGIPGRDTNAIARQVEELKAQGYDIRVRERYEPLEEDPRQPDFRYVNTWAMVPYYYLDTLDIRDSEDAGAIEADGNNTNA